METWRAKRKEQREEFANSASLLTGSLNSATANMIQQRGILAAQVALKRLQDANAAKAAKAAAQSQLENSGYRIQEEIAARHRDIALGVAVDVST